METEVRELSIFPQSNGRERRVALSSGHARGQSVRGRLFRIPIRGTKLIEGISPWHGYLSSKLRCYLRALDCLRLSYDSPG